MIEKKKVFKIIKENFKFPIFLILLNLSMITYNTILNKKNNKELINLETNKNKYNEFFNSLKENERIKVKFDFYQKKEISKYQYPIKNFKFEALLEAIYKKFSFMQEFKELKYEITTIDKHKIEDIILNSQNIKKDAITYNAKIKIISDYELISHYFTDAIIVLMPGVLNINKFSINIKEDLVEKIIIYKILNKNFDKNEIKNKINTELDFSISIVNA